MGGEWVEKAIGDIADVIGGSTPSTRDPANFDGDVPWLTPKDLSGPHARYVKHGERNLSRGGLKNSSAQLLPPNSVLLSSRAPIGYLAIAANPIATNQGFRSLVVKQDYDHEFLYYWLSANVEELERHASGSTFKELSGTALKQIRLRLPVDRAEQRAIAHILGTLDDKIELTRRMNKTLEAMARALFKSWFVDFDPVHHNIARRMASLPKAQTGRWFVYALECEGGSLYIGFTDDLERRYEEHRSGRGADWTKAHPPVRVAYWETTGSREDAVEREKKLKSGSGREWLKREIELNWTPRRPLPCRLPVGRQGRQVPAHLYDLFPDSFEDSELGEIPKGWGVMPLPEAIEVNPGGSLRKGETAPYLDMANMPTRGHTPDNVVERQFGSGMRFINGDTLVARITPSLENGKTAFVDFLKEGQVGWGSTEYIVLRPKPPLPEEFAYCLGRSNEFREFAIQSMTGSSGRQRVPAESLSHYLLTVAPEQVAKQFGLIIKPLFARASAAARESRILAAQRDALLPKLISGDLRVEKLEYVSARCASRGFD